MKNIYRHGELVLKETELPKDAVLQKTVKKEILAHSETGQNGGFTKKQAVWLLKFLDEYIPVF